MTADGMTCENLLPEAQALRERGLEFTWVAQESMIYQRLFETLSSRLSSQEMMCHIESDWLSLIANQQQWFAELRAETGVLSLPPTRQTANVVQQVVGC